MFSHDSLVEVTKPHYADDPVSTKDAFSNLTLMEALKALVIFCRDRLEQLTLDPVCDRFAQDLCALDAMGIARHFFSLREGPEWVGLFAGRLGAVTENQAPMYFGPANKKAFKAIVRLLQGIGEGNWPPVVGVFGELVVLVDKVLLPNMAEPGEAAGGDPVDSETKGTKEGPTAGKIPNKVGRPRKALSYGGFVDALKEDKRREHWKQPEWGTHFKCSRQTIGRSDGWKKIQSMRTKESRSVVQRTGEDESASTEDD